MRGEVDTLPFVLAEQWGCTLAEVDELPAIEVERWRAWHAVGAELRRAGLGFRR